MAKKKIRKAPAVSPGIKPRIPPVAAQPGPASDPHRPDPDQPPITGTTGRPSVYSEWLNTTERPPAPSAWLNSPVGDDSALRAAMADVGLGARPDANQAAGQPGPRKRLSTRARKLAEAERLRDEAEARGPRARGTYDSGRQLAPTVPARSTQAPTPGGNTPRSTRVMPAMPAMPGDGRAAGGMGTSGRMPATGRPAGAGGRRATAGALTALADQPTARVPASPRSGAGATAQSSVARKTGGLAPPGATTGSVVIRGARVPTATGPVVPRRLRPPSFVMQGIVALATVIVLLGVLTVSSPLGYGAALSGTFQAYANEVPWVPTPTPTATSVPLNTTFGGVPPSPGQQVIVNEIKQIFGQYAQGALNVSHCESGWDPSARNPYPVGNSHAEGVFQILYPSTWNGTSYASRNPYDYDANIRAAWEIFHRDGNSWAEWECKP